MKKYKRRNFFIKKDFQGKLILGYFLFVLGGCLFFVFLIGLFSADTLTISYTNNDLQLGQTPFMLLQKTLAAQWIFVVIGAVFVILAAMALTHRIAGPLFRLEKALDNMQKKKLNDTIVLRSKDEGKELARKINSFNLDLSKNIKELKRNSEAMADILQQAGGQFDNLPEEQKSIVHSILWNLDEKNKKIQMICSSYTTKNEE